MPKKNKKRNSSKQKRDEQSVSQQDLGVQEGRSEDVNKTPGPEASAVPVNSETQVSRLTSEQISETSYSTVTVEQSFPDKGTSLGAEGGIDLTIHALREQQQQTTTSKNHVTDQHWNIRDEQLAIDLPISRENFLTARPDAGSKIGKPIDLIINCLNVSIKPMKIFMYDIELTKAEAMGADQKKRDITVRTKKKDNLREVMQKFLEGKPGCPVFDGGRIIFNNKLLPFKDGVQPIFNCNLDGDNVDCHFTILHAKEEDIELENLINYVESGAGRSDDMPQEALRALDTIMREMFLNKNLISIGRRAIFDPKTSIPMKCGPYVLIDGYVTTIRPHMSRIRFNFDKTQIVCHAAMNLLDYILNWITSRRGGDLDIKMLTPKLRTVRVQSNHLKTPEGVPYLRKYTVCGFSKKNAKEEKIPERNITIEEYFLKDYNIKLKRPDLLMIKVNPVRDIFIPIELLEILPYQKVVEDTKIVAEVIRYSAIPCNDRLEKLKTAIRTLGLADRTDKFMRNYMIEIDPNFITVNARILGGPDALFGDEKMESISLGKWNIRGKTFCKPFDKDVKWAFFAVGTERDYQRNDLCLYEVEEKLPKAARYVGINMSGDYQFNYVLHHEIEDMATNLINDCKKNQKNLDLLVFVVRKDEDYRAVKRFGDMVWGIPTQCMNYENLAKQRNLDQYLGNIMLKINGKLGGQNWELPAITNSTFTPIKGPFMVFGIDVTHPSSTRNDLMKSIAAMVGSIDETATLYSAVIRQQMSKEARSIIEVVLEMEDMVLTLLTKFYQVNRKLKPQHLIFYRDGVSEGQFEIVFEREIIAIKRACEKLEKNYQPRITYIVVQKRHKIRFFPKDSTQGIGKSGNVPSGTIVDKDITHCREFDFYLCSHEGIQGTSKPAHYHVLFDENNWSSKDLQIFTYFLCHAYASCTKSVSYPAPTYYAHLAAFRGRTLIGQPQDDDDNISVSSIQSSRSCAPDSIIPINDLHSDKLFFV